MGWKSFGQDLFLIRDLLDKNDEIGLVVGPKGRKGWSCSKRKGDWRQSNQEDRHVNRKSDDEDWVRCKSANVENDDEDWVVRSVMLWL